MKDIRDDDQKISRAYFKSVFSRSNRVKELAIKDWILLTIVEVIFGEELLEHLTITAAYNENEAQKVGHFLHLRYLVPAGFFTNLFRKQLYQVIYYKYFKHYLFLVPESELDENEYLQLDGSLMLNRARFGMRHDLLCQTIPFRRVYLLIWVFLNLAIDLLVWLTGDFQAAIVSAVSIEAIRRFLKL